MRVGIQSWSFREKFRSEPGFTVFKELDETARMGFTGIEIMSGKAGQGAGDLESFDPMYLDRVTRHARAAGVAITALAPYNDFAYLTDERWRLANIAYINDMLKIASDMQVPEIRVMTGYLVKDRPTEELEKLVIDAFRKLVPVAESVGVNMCVENHSSVMADAEGLVRLLTAVGSKRLTVCPDPTNFSPGVFGSDATPEQRERVYTETARIAPFATNSHLKFKGFDAEGRWLCIDLPRLLAIYRQAGYDRTISIESIDEPDLLANLPKARQVLEKAIADSSKAKTK